MIRLITPGDYATLNSYQLRDATASPAYGTLEFCIRPLHRDLIGET